MNAYKKHNCVICFKRDVKQVVLLEWQHQSSQVEQVIHILEGVEPETERPQHMFFD